MTLSAVQNDLVEHLRCTGLQGASAWGALHDAWAVDFNAFGIGGALRHTRRGCHALRELRDMPPLKIWGAQHRAWWDVFLLGGEPEVETEVLTFGE